MDETETDEVNCKEQVASTESSVPNSIEAMIMINPNAAYEVPTHAVEDTTQLHTNGVQNLIPTQFLQQTTIRIQPFDENIQKSSRSRKSGNNQRPILPNTLLASRIPLGLNDGCKLGGHWVLTLQFIPNVS